jgi:hypothetical protein
MKLFMTRNIIMIHNKIIFKIIKIIIAHMKILLKNSGINKQIHHNKTDLNLLNKFMI